MRDDRDAIDDANAHNQNEVQDGVENTALIGKLIGEISDEVDFLDTIMGNKYERQPQKLRAWDSASRVERAPVRSKKEKPASVVAPPPPRPNPSRVLGCGNIFRLGSSIPSFAWDQGAEAEFPSDSTLCGFYRLLAGKSEDRLKPVRVLFPASSL